MALKPNNDFLIILKTFIPFLSSDDVTIANLGTTFTDSDRKISSLTSTPAVYAKSLTPRSLLKA